jgi:cytochrome c oxidase cbb3-type subunit 3
MKQKFCETLLFIASGLFLLVPVSCKKQPQNTNADAAFGAYDTEPDWNDTSKLIKLGYAESQGKHVFYTYCVWCHADATPAGPSNRSNLTPIPPLMNDGEKLNGEGDEYLQNVITLGGGALGKSEMMPPYGKTLTPVEIKAVIAYTRAVAQPPYQKPGRPGSQYAPK